MTFRAPVADRKITDILKEKFTLSVEVVPPRNGVSPQQIFSQIESLVRSGADFMAVTKGAGGSLRGGSLPIAQIIKDQFGLPCIAHFTCRDLVPEEVENHLVDHHFLGIRNILALRGDPPQGADICEEREGAHHYAYQLVEQIIALNRGEFLHRAGYKVSHCEPMNFCVGVACYPDHANELERIDYLKRKVDAGAEFAVSQMLFGSESYARFLDECARHRISIPILPGTCVFRSQEQASRLAKRFGLEVNLKSLQTLPLTDLEAADQDEKIVDNFVQHVDAFKRVGAPGLHAFLIGADLQLMSRALREVKTNEQFAGPSGLREKRVISARGSA